VITTQARVHLNKLEQRRQELGISRPALAKMSGVPLATTNRILSGSAPSANFANVARIADALGMDIFVAREPSQKLREQQAAKKARHLVGMVQATSGLEGQAVDDALLSDMTNQTIHELLSGSARRLWSD